MRTKECEIQLSQSRAEDHRKRAEAEAAKSRQLSSQVSTFTQTESELRSQLNIYVEKFKQVSSVFSCYCSGLKVYHVGVPCLLATLFSLCVGVSAFLSLWLYLINFCNAGGGHPQQLKRSFLNFPQRDGGDVKENQTPGKGKPQFDSQA